MLTIYPYKPYQTWVFDDERTGLKEEAFVGGMTEIIDRLVDHAGLEGAERGFALTFADAAFPGSEATVDWTEKDPSGAGDWYEGTVAGLPMRGWLCPALLLYFRVAPPAIHVMATPLPAGVNPIWRPSDGVPTRRFVSAPASPAGASLGIRGLDGSTDSEDMSPDYRNMLNAMEPR